MSTIRPAPEPGDPLRVVVKRRPAGAANVDTLECGHTVVDFGRGFPNRRRCRSCGRLPGDCPECDARAGYPCELTRIAHLAALAPAPHASRGLG